MNLIAMLSFVLRTKHSSCVGAAVLCTEAASPAGFDTRLQTSANFSLSNTVSVKSITRRIICFFLQCGEKYAIIPREVNAMPRFFMLGTNLSGGRAMIYGRDAEHIRVLRLRPGESLTVCDGMGTDYRCRLVRSDRDEAEAEVVEVVPCKAEPRVKTKVICGLPKGDKTDFIIQKAVEAGACEIMFTVSERCIVKPEQAEKKLERWNRISEEAAKQSGRGIIPQVSLLNSFASALDAAKKCELALFMYETGERESLSNALSEAKNVTTAAIITGPEGGFEKYEVDLARACGMHICTMGNRILRCETAPIVALSALMFASGDLE